MTRHRTTALLLTSVALAATAAATASAAPPKKSEPIVFPLLGEFPFDDNYGDPRVNGSHAGIDTMAPRRTPVLAAEDGKIKWWTTSARAGCMLYLYGKSGTTYLYIHLNNDRTLGNDNRAGCVKDLSFTVADGATVTAGQQIALSGDSGDANGNPHLHFEVHPNDGADVDPFPYMKQAVHALFPARVGATFSLGLRGTPVSAGGGKLVLRAASVRWWPGGRWTSIGSRLVELKVGAAAKVDSSLAAALASPEARDLQSRSDAEPVVTVFTGAAKVTAAALRGEAGALTAARVTRPGGSLVDAGPADTPDDGGAAADDSTAEPVPGDDSTSPDDRNPSPIDKVAVPPAPADTSDRNR